MSLLFRVQSSIQTAYIGASGFLENNQRCCESKKFWRPLTKCVEVELARDLEKRSWTTANAGGYRETDGIFVGKGDIPARRACVVPTKKILTVVLCARRLTAARALNTSPAALCRHSIIYYDQTRGWHIYTYPVLTYRTIRVHNNALFAATIRVRVLQRRAPRCNGIIRHTYFYIIRFGETRFSDKSIFCSYTDKK